MIHQVCQDAQFEIIQQDSFEHLQKKYLCVTPNLYSPRSNSRRQLSPTCNRTSNQQYPKSKLKRTQELDSMYLFMCLCSEKPPNQPKFKEFNLKYQNNSINDSNNRINDDLENEDSLIMQISDHPQNKFRESRSEMNLVEREIEQLNVIKSVKLLKQLPE